jgi:hypothetical protein
VYAADPQAVRDEDKEKVKQELSHGGAPKTVH